MISAPLIWFIVVVILGVVGNYKAVKTRAFDSWNIWFWNVVWVLVLRLVWI